MEDDLISCLTRQVKEEVLENYLRQRRLVDLQIEDFHEMVRGQRDLADDTGKRLTRLGHLMIRPSMVQRLGELVRIPEESFWAQCLSKPFNRGLRFIRVSAFTNKSKFRKLVFESYRRFLRWMDRYRENYRELELECRALNINIDSFQNNFDLLTILNFLKSLDVCTLEQRHFLGGNFTAEEITSVEKKLYIPPVDLASLDVPKPFPPPSFEAIESKLARLAQEVYARHQSIVRRVVR